MNIKIYNNTKSIFFDLDIVDRVTILKGNSATGKSTLVRAIDTYNSSSGGVTIESPVELYHISLQTLQLVERLKDDSIYIMDEMDGINSKEAAKFINDKRYTFILITRDESLPNVSYAVSNIYELYESGKYIKNRLIKDNIK